MEIDEIGGLGLLVSAIEDLKFGFSETARTIGLPFPKGWLLAGVPGTGKTHSAKVIASQLGYPMLSLEIDKIKVGGLPAMARVLEIAKLCCPCVFYLDEIEKLFSREDKPLLSLLLTWLQDKDFPVFVIGTLNRIEDLPVETTRAGRFDRVAHHLNNVSMAVPQALQEVWQEEREARQADDVARLERDRDRQVQLEKDHQKFLQKLGGEYVQLQALLKKAIDRTGDSRYLKLQALCWGLGGCISGLGLATIMGVLIIFPRQLSAARGSDGAMLEWLSTSDGRLMRRSFAAGNKSVAECVRKAGKKSKGKVVCMLEIN